MDIDIKKCIGNATDGAANMQGQYKGFSALLTGASPNQVHIWCPQPCSSWHYRGRCGRWVPFLTIEWHCRVHSWFLQAHEEISEDKGHRRLGVIGETLVGQRWGLEESIWKVCKAWPCTLHRSGHHYGKNENYVTMKPVIRNKAQGYKAALLKYESILTAEIFLRIFERTIPLCK